MTDNSHDAVGVDKVDNIIHASDGIDPNDESTFPKHMLESKERIEKDETANTTVEAVSRDSLDVQMASSKNKIEEVTFDNKVAKRLKSGSMKKASQHLTAVVDIIILFQLTLKDDKLTHIGKGVSAHHDAPFFECKALISVDLSFCSKLEILGNYCFCGCRYIEVLKLPPSLKSIGEECFVACENLKSIALTDNVKHLGKFAFNRCMSLSELVLPPTALKEIGIGDFQGRSGLPHVLEAGEGGVQRQAAVHRPTSLQALYVGRASKRKRAVIALVANSRRQQRQVLRWSTSTFPIPSRQLCVARSASAPS